MRGQAAQRSTCESKTLCAILSALVRKSPRTERGLMRLKIGLLVAAAFATSCTVAPCSFAHASTISPGQVSQTVTFGDSLSDAGRPADALALKAQSVGVPVWQVAPPIKLILTTWRVADR